MNDDWVAMYGEISYERTSAAAVANGVYKARIVLYGKSRSGIQSESVLM